jgi:phosphoglycolate phosphatase-like HAD superfamily hydrolase
MKKLIVFDLDGTLAESKSSLDAEMATLLGSLLDIVRVAVAIRRQPGRALGDGKSEPVSGPAPLDRLALEHLLVVCLGNGRGLAVI